MADNNYQYSSDNTLLALITLIKNALRGKANTGDVPTKVSQLTNDSKFQTETQVSTTVTNAVKDKADKSEIPTKTSQLTNDSNFVTNTYHDTTKQDVIGDLDDIRSGAALGATALQSFTETDPTVPSHVKNITTANINAWNNKQNAISDLADIRSGAALGATALQSFTETDPTVPSHVKSIKATDIAAWDAKQAAISDLETIRSGAALGATALQSVPTTYALKTDIPSKVSQLTNDSKFQTDTQVTTAINNAIKDITGIKFEVVTSLPATGVNGTIYLVAHSHGEKDIYDEYIYVNSKWEKIGSTDIDLSGYVLKSDMHEITSEEVTTIWNGVTA